MLKLWLMISCFALHCRAQAPLQPLLNSAPPAGASGAQTAASEQPERWNLFYQATSVGQYHGEFHSPYAGPLSLQSYTERDVSLTTTLFFGFRLEKNTQLYFDPE